MSAIVAVAALGVAMSAAAGQACSGLRPLTNLSYRADAWFITHRYARGTGVSVGAGRRWFGSIGYGTTYDPDLDQNTDDFTVAVGMDRTTDNRAIALCPRASVTVSTGHLDPFNPSWSNRIVDASLAYGVARVPSSSGSRVGMGASVRISRVSVSPYTTLTGGNTYEALSAFVGIPVIRSIALRAVVTVPFGLPGPGRTPMDLVVPFGVENHELSLTLLASATLGRSDD